MGRKRGLQSQRGRVAGVVVLELACLLHEARLAAGLRRALGLAHVAHPLPVRRGQRMCLREGAQRRHDGGILCGAERTRLGGGALCIVAPRRQAVPAPSRRQGLRGLEHGHTTRETHAWCDRLTHPSSGAAASAPLVSAPSADRARSARSAAGVPAGSALPDGPPPAVAEVVPRRPPAPLPRARCGTGASGCPAAPSGRSLSPASRPFRFASCAGCCGAAACASTSLRFRRFVTFALSPCGSGAP